jgi:ribosomal protein L34E
MASSGRSINIHLTLHDSGFFTRVKKAMKTKKATEAKCTNCEKLREKIQKMEADFSQYLTVLQREVERAGRYIESNQIERRIESLEDKLGNHK